MNDEKDYKSMSFDEAVELDPPEFYKWCVANPCNAIADKYLLKEIKGDLDEK